MSGEMRIKRIPAFALYRNPQETLRVAAYCRVSTLYEDQDTSIEAQISYYQELIHKHPGWQLVDIYVDRASGRNMRMRKGLQRLLTDCREKKIDLVLTKSISRLGRDTLHLLLVLQELQSLNVDVYFEIEKLYSNNPHATLMITILGSLAQEESRSKSENIKWGINHSFRDPQSKYLNRPCYGYRAGSDNILQIHPYEATVIILIFQLAADGKSLRQIGRQLQDLGIRSPRGRERWAPETIRYILSNEKYMGDVRLQKTFIKDYLSGKQTKNTGELAQYYISNSHEAIIGRESFEKKDSSEDHIAHPYA